MTVKEEHLVNAMLVFASKVSEASKCPRAQHGCVLTDMNLQVISYGYNGPARGVANKCLRPDEPGNCGCVHAEANAVAKAGAWNEPKIAFITGTPCERCASLLLNANAQMVITMQDAHRDYPEGPEMLERAGVKCYNYAKLTNPDALFNILRKGFRVRRAT